MAVLGFQNLSNESSAEWLNTALTEMLSTELAAGGRLRTVPGELVSRVKLEMALPNSQTLTEADACPSAQQPERGLRRIGSLPLRSAKEPARRYGSISACRTPEMANSWPRLPTPARLLELVNLVTNAGALLRRQLARAPA